MERRCQRWRGEARDGSDRALSLTPQSNGTLIPNCPPSVSTVIACLSDDVLAVLIVNPYNCGALQYASGGHSVELGQDFTLEACWPSGKMHLFCVTKKVDAF